MANMLKKFGFLLLLLAVQLPATADVASNKRHEIQYLLSYVRDSACVIDSEGEKLTGLFASAHLQQRYARHQRDISTAENFIEYTAAKSSMPGKYSMVSCPGKIPARTIDWLKRALDVYRIKRRF